MLKSISWSENKFSISVTRTIANLCYLDKKWYGCIETKVIRTKEQSLRCSFSLWTHPWEFFEKFGNFDKNQWKSQFLCLEKGKDIGKMIEWRLFEVKQHMVNITQEQPSIEKCKWLSSNRVQSHHSCKANKNRISKPFFFVFLIAGFWSILSNKIIRLTISRD